MPLLEELERRPHSLLMQIVGRGDAENLLEAEPQFGAVNAEVPRQVFHSGRVGQICVDGRAHALNDLTLASRQASRCGGLRQGGHRQT